MRYFPIFLDLCGRRVLVVGGGRVAERMVSRLLAGGARVTVVSPRLTVRLRRHAQTGRLRHLARGYRVHDLRAAALVFGATDDRAVNHAIAKAARGRGLWVSVVDAPEESGFLVPAVVTRGALVLAVSTGGASPALARRIRRELARTYGPEYGTVVRLLADARRLVQGQVSSGGRRRVLLTRLAKELPRLVRQYGPSAASSRIGLAGTGSVRARRIGA